MPACRLDCSHHDTGAERHKGAVAVFVDIIASEYGQSYTSEYILDEAITFRLEETLSSTGLRSIGIAIFDKRIVDMHLNPVERDDWLYCATRPTLF